jgi:hypothetical protein
MSESRSHVHSMRGPGCSGIEIFLPLGSDRLVIRANFSPRPLGEIIEDLQENIWEYLTMWVVGDA